jgi:hypothetical protein
MPFDLEAEQFLFRVIERRQETGDMWQFEGVFVKLT